MVFSHLRNATSRQIHHQYKVSKKSCCWEMLSSTTRQKAKYCSSPFRCVVVLLNGVLEINRFKISIAFVLSLYCTGMKTPNYSKAYKMIVWIS